MTGPVRWLSGAESLALQRRDVKDFVGGELAAPQACVSTVLACGATLRRVELKMPETARWAACITDVLDAVAHSCAALRELQLLLVPPPTPAGEHAAAEHAEWPQSACAALLALLRRRRPHTLLLSLTETLVPPEMLAGLGEAAGASLRRLHLYPYGFYGEQLVDAAIAGAPGLVHLESLTTSWHMAPRLLAAFLAASPALVCIEVFWWHHPMLPRTLAPQALAELLSQPQYVPPPALLAVQDMGMPREVTANELDGCLLALAIVAARAAAAARAAGEGSDAPAARPLIVESSDAGGLSAAGLAAARHVYPQLTVRLPDAPDDDDAKFAD